MIKEVNSFHSGKFTYNGIFSGRPGKLVRAQALIDMVASVPVLPEVAEQKLVRLPAASIHAQASIEGSTLSLSEVENIISQKEGVIGHDPLAIRIYNLKNLYKYIASQSSEEGFEITSDTVHSALGILVKGLSGSKDEEGHYRNGEAKVYKDLPDCSWNPPSSRLDVNFLMKNFYLWINSDEMKSAGSLFRAVCTHLYIAKILPFHSFNGVIGRYAESLIVRSGGGRFVPYSLSIFYNNNRERYLKELAGFFDTNDPSSFADFAAEGVIDTLQDISRQSIENVQGVTLENYLENLLKEKRINKRQFELLMLLVNVPEGFTPPELQLKKEYVKLYGKVSRTTVARDVKKLHEMGLLKGTEDDRFYLNRGILTSCVRSFF
ncbi:Fic family protein [Limisalsivibrio acetivorans]|uniref:Fic family protein n=1 Tax=Limisalsivibrio acetivorans TaxID=1304888 RepID=UPI0003B6AF0C|nr:hypothetical protein [Limisalsivibrio acetivorans]